MLTRSAPVPEEVIDMLSKVNVKYWISGFVMVLVCASVSLAQSKPQVKPVSDTKADKKDQSDDKMKSVDTSGPSVYVKGKRSPFEDPNRRPNNFHPATVRLFPPVEERLRDYMSRRAQAKANGTRIPLALSAFLVEELEVNGIFKTKDGYGALVRAKPTNQTYFVHQGEKVFNGEIKRLEAKQVVFTSITWMVNGKDETKEVTKVIQAPAGDASSAEAKQ
jgi:hypothetical protein